MEVKIQDQTDNKLFGRKDVRFMLAHEGEATPSRVAVRQLVASELGTKTEHIVIDHMESATGMGKTRGLARAYPSADAARAQERTHLLKRNNLYKEEKKEGAE